MVESPFWGVEEVATYFGASAKTIYRYSKEIPGYIKIFGRVMFHKQTLIEAYERHKLAKSCGSTGKTGGNSNPHEV